LILTDKYLYNKKLQSLIFACIIVFAVLAINVYAAEDPVPNFIEFAYRNFGAGMDIFVQGCVFVIDKMKNLVINETNMSDFTDGVTAAGVTLTSMFFAMGVFSDLAMFRVERIEEAIKVAMKFVIAKIIIENTDTIMLGIKGLLFDTLAVDELTSAFSTFGTDIMSSLYPTATTGDLDGLVAVLAGMFGLNYVLNIVLVELPVFIVIVVTMTTIIITIAGILFEMGIHIVVAPIALSTLVNEMTRPTGITFIKSYSAVCLQTLIIAAMVRVYQIINTNAINLVDFGSFTSSGGVNIGNLGVLVESIVRIVMPIIALICLTTGIKKSGDITKRMLGV
jgi:hypothetical protein